MNMVRSEPGTSGNMVTAWHLSLRNMVTVRGESHSFTKAGTTTVIREEMLGRAVRVIS